MTTVNSFEKENSLPQPEDVNEDPEQQRINETSYIDEQAAKAGSETNIHLARLRRISESLSHLLEGRSMELKELITFLLRQQKQEVILEKEKEGSGVAELKRTFRERIGSIFQKTIAGLRQGVEVAPEVLKIINALEVRPIDGGDEGGIGRNLLAVLHLASGVNEIAQQKGIISDSGTKDNKLKSMVGAVSGFLTDNPKFRLWIVETINRAKSRN